MLEFTGSIVKVGEVQSFGSKGFTKRDLIVKEAKQDEKWPNVVPFVLVKDNCKLADGLKEGDKVKVSFVLNGRVWNPTDGRPTRYFCDNTILKMEILESSASAKPVPPPAEPPSDMSVVDDGTDMPF